MQHSDIKKIVELNATRKEESKCRTSKCWTVKAVAEKSGILRETLYNRLKGVGEFTASEIVSLSNTLNLSPTERDDIFLKWKLNEMQLK